MNNIAKLGQSQESQLALIRRTVAADTNNDEFNLFIHTARHLRLDPLRRQIYAFVFSKDNPAKRRMSIITAIDGFRTIADRTGCYRPDEDEPTFEVDAAAKGPNNPAGLVKAVVRVFKFSNAGWHKITASAYWDEYAPLKDEWVSGDDGKRRPSGKLTLDTSGNWGKMPRLMLAKVAEALALRKGWPDDFSSVYADEEIDRARTIEASAWEAANEGEEELRMKRIGAGKTILFQFEPTGKLEPVDIGKVFDRLAEFVKNNKDEASVLGSFRHRNEHALREFWAKSPTDALEAKKLFESTIDKASSQT